MKTNIIELESRIIRNICVKKLSFQENVEALDSNDYDYIILEFGEYYDANEITLTKYQLFADMLVDILNYYHGAGDGELPIEELSVMDAFYHTNLSAMKNNGVIL